VVLRSSADLGKWNEVGRRPFRPLVVVHVDGVGAVGSDPRNWRPVRPAFGVGGRHYCLGKAGRVYALRCGGEGNGSGKDWRPVQPVTVIRGGGALVGAESGCGGGRRPVRPVVALRVSGSSAIGGDGCALAWLV